MSKGKIANQVAHASIGASRRLPLHIIDRWMINGLQTKIILKVENFEELTSYYSKCLESDLKPYLVTNLTEDKWYNKETCMGVGPYTTEKFLNSSEDFIFKNLKLL